MPVGLETLIGVNMKITARRPTKLPLFSISPRSIPRPPTSPVTPCAPIARIAIESAIILGMFAALSAFVARVVHHHTTSRKPKTTCTTQIRRSRLIQSSNTINKNNNNISNDYDYAIIAFHNFHFSAL